MVLAERAESRGLDILVHPRLHLCFHQLLGRLGKVAAAKRCLEDGKPTLRGSAARLDQSDDEEGRRPAGQLVRMSAPEVLEVCLVRDALREVGVDGHLLEAASNQIGLEKTKALEPLLHSGSEMAALNEPPG